MALKLFNQKPRPKDISTNSIQMKKIREITYSNELSKLVKVTEKIALEEANKKGVIDARKNHPFATDTHASPAEQKITSLVQKSIGKLEEYKQIIAKAIDELKTENRIYQDDKSNSQEVLTKKSLMAEAKKEEIRKNRSQKVATKKEQIQEKTDSVKTAILDKESQVKGQEAEGGFSNFIPDPNTKRWIALSLLAAGFEVIISYQAFFVLRENLIMSIGGAFAYGFLIWLLAKGAGHAFCNYKCIPKSKYLRYGLLFILGGLTAAIMLFLLRWQSLNAFFVALIISVLSFLTFLGAVYTEFRAHVPSSYKKYLKNKAELQEIKNELTNLEVQAHSIEESIVDDMNKVDDDLNKEINSKKGELDTQYRKLKDIHFELQEPLHFFRGIEIQLVEIQKAAIGQYRHVNEEKRTDFKIPQYWKNPEAFPTLKKYFDRLELPEINPIGFGGINTSTNSEEKSKNEPVIHYNGNGKHETANPYLYLILLFVSSIFISCTEQPEIEKNKVLIIDILDTSKDYQTDTVFDINRSNQLLERLKNENREITYMTTTVGSTSLNQTETITIPAKSFIDNPLNRKEEEKNFTEVINEMMKIQFQKRIDNDEKKSLLYEGFCQVSSDVLNNSDWGKHEVTIILKSDGIQNSPYYSFYNLDKQTFNPTPEKVDEIKSALEKSMCSIPNLSGVNVILEYQTNVENELFVSKVRLFWKGLLESKGATVSFKSKI